MNRRSAHYFKALSQNVVVCLLVIGIAGLGALKADQLACEPDCPMHQTKMDQPSCCDVVETNHHAMLNGGVPENHGAPLPCCDGKFCSDSTFDIQEIAANNTAFPDIPVAAPIHSTSTVSAIFAPSRKVSAPVYHPGKTIPIYILTCVYLI